MGGREDANGDRSANEPNDANAFAALRSGFPADLDSVAIETADVDRDDGGPAFYLWRDLDRGSAMIANLLDAVGLPPASRVLAQTDKSVEALMLHLAVLRAGHVHVPLNAAYRPAEIGHFLEDSEPAVAVCRRADFGSFAPAAFAAGARHVFTLDDDRRGSLLDRASAFSDRHAVAPRSTGDPAAILYTSGTTGRSKGAVLSHGNLAANARTLQALWRWRPDDVLIHALPIFHIHGLFVAAHGALLNGSRTIWFSRFDAAAVAARLPDATVFMGVPTHYVRLLAESGLTREVCRSMRLFVSGSAPLSAETFAGWRERTGFSILERYGMSETLIIASNPCDPGDGERRAGTVGRALPGVDLRLAHDDGTPIERGCDGGGAGADAAVGGIQVRGPSVFAGYWQMPEKTREEFVEDSSGRPWFKTGDLGRFDVDGYLSIVGRSKDLVISGGFNVYPAEVERALAELPGVADSAVVGVPHPDFGEAVVAVVVAKAGETLDERTLMAALRHRIAGFKVPKRIVFADELPRNAMGKLQKNLLRDANAGLFAERRASP